MKNYKRVLKETIIMFVGSVILAMSFTMFYIPANLVTGGVGGMSIIASNRYGIEPSLFILIGNIVLFTIGFIFMGKKFAFKTTLGTLVFPLAMYLTKDIPTITTDPLLCSVAGGVTAGIGLGIIFRIGASTGGMDIPPHILKKFFRIPLSVGVMIFDAPIILLGGLVFGYEAVIYALISLYIFSRTMDATIIGTNSNKALYIMTRNTDEIIEVINSKFQRGATLLQSKGSYTKEERETILCVLKTREYVRLRQEILGIDPTAFLIIMNAAEIHGEGFEEE
jgi:uncharacterized membrane-anchored protein YitT (DUF2179 family)